MKTNYHFLCSLLLMSIGRTDAFFLLDILCDMFGMFCPSDTENPGRLPTLTAATTPTTPPAVAVTAPPSGSTRKPSSLRPTIAPFTTSPSSSPSKTPTGSPTMQPTGPVLFQDEPNLSNSDIAKVMNWIKKEVTIVRNPFCWKDTYERGIGTIPGRMADCPSGYVNDGATCRRPTDDILAPSHVASCPSGYANTGLTCYRGPRDIYSPSHVAHCPKGWTNFGLTCTEALGTGGCSVIAFWNCDTFTILGSKGRMRCDSGYFLSDITARCHKHCPSGYTNTGESCHRVAVSLGTGDMFCKDDRYFVSLLTGRCHKKCPDGYENTGETCHRPLIVKGLSSMTCKSDEDKIGGRCYPKGGDLGSCFNDQENDAGLCYDKCKSGFYGVSFVCWQHCDNSHVDCGAGCATSSLECGLAVANQIIAPIIIAANLLTLGLADAAADATRVVVVAGRRIGYTKDAAKYGLKALDHLQTINASGKPSPTLFRRIFDAKLGKNNIIRTKTEVASLGYEAHEAVEQYRAVFAQNFADQTSGGIEKELDSHFVPDTALFLKKAWADIQLEELAVANDWLTASTVLLAASLVDPTGVVGAVEAYAKPSCGAVVPFPCTAGNLDGSVACR